MQVTWDDETDAVIDGDLTAALGYTTPLGGVVVQAVAPIGLRDRVAGVAGFTTSLGFSKKLVAIARDPHVALAFHADAGEVHCGGRGLTGRKVIAFLSQVHFDPDLSQETFVLEPEGEDAAPEG